GLHYLQLPGPAPPRDALRQETAGPQGDAGGTDAAVGPRQGERPALPGSETERPGDRGGTAGQTRVSLGPHEPGRGAGPGSAFLLALTVPALAQEAKQETMVPFKGTGTGTIGAFIVPSAPPFLAMNLNGTGQATPIGGFTGIANLRAHLGLDGNPVDGTDG